MPHKNRKSKKALKRHHKKKETMHMHRKLLTLTNGMPKTTTLKLRYCDYCNIQSASGLIGGFEYFCAGLYDPQVTVGGHQPMGFDQYMQNYYNLAYVLSSEITVKASQGASSTGAPIAVGVYAYDSANDNLVAQNYDNWNTFKEAGSEVGTIATVKASTTVRARYNTKSMIGGNVLDQLNNANTLTGNPQPLMTGSTSIGCAGWKYYIWCQTLDRASSSEVVVCDVTIDYIVKFTDRIPLEPS